MKLTKLLLLWILASTVTLIVGWGLLLHGGVYSESAGRVGETKLLFEIEVIAGQVLLWPTYGIA